MTQEGLNRMALALGLLLAIIYLFFDPQELYFPRCPVLAVTGYKCPGCGVQRALHQLLQGNFVASAQFNALFIPMLLYAGPGLLLKITGQQEKFQSFTNTLYSRKKIGIVLALALLFGVIRNIWGC